MVYDVKYHNTVEERRGTNLGEMYNYVANIDVWA
jgi:hypothetical protein